MEAFLFLEGCGGAGVYPLDSQQIRFESLVITGFTLYHSNDQSGNSDDNEHHTHIYIYYAFPTVNCSILLLMRGFAEVRDRGGSLLHRFRRRIWSCSLLSKRRQRGRPPRRCGDLEAVRDDLWVMVARLRHDHMF